MGMQRKSVGQVVQIDLDEQNSGYSRDLIEKGGVLRTAGVVQYRGVSHFTYTTGA